MQVRRDRVSTFRQPEADQRLKRAEPEAPRTPVSTRPAWERSAFEPSVTKPSVRRPTPSAQPRTTEPMRPEVSSPSADGLRGVGSQLGADNGPQLLWTGSNPAVVGTITDLARRQGKLTDETLNENYGLANQAVPDEQPRRFSSRELVGLAQQSGLPIEKLDPNQAAQAANYINEATSAKDQRDRIAWSLSNLQLAADNNLPTLSRKEQTELLWAAAEIPGHALANLSDTELSAKFQELARATNAPGESTIKVGEHEVHLKVGADGRIEDSETKKPSFLSRVGGALASVGNQIISGALDVTHALTEPIVSLIRGAPTTGPTLAYDQLSPRQQGLLEGGRRAYDSPTPLQKGGFLLLTQRLDKAGIDYSGLHIKGGTAGIEQAKIKLDGPPEALANFRRSFEESLRNGRFLFERPAGVFHAGENDTGGRENRADYSLQIGIGPEGAFVDIDRYNTLAGKAPEHFFLEVLIGGNTVNPFDAARYLGEELGPKK